MRKSRVMNSFLKSFKYAFIILFLFSNFSYSYKGKLDVKKFNSFFKGTWELIEWHQEGKVYKRPLIAGRCTLSPNFIHCGIHKKFNSNNKTSWIGWGHYILENGKYGYKYTEVLSISDKLNKDIKIDRSLPWSGYRYFEIEESEEGFYMTSESGQQLWNIYKNEVMTYTDKSSMMSKGKLMKRVWKKIN